MKPSIIRFKCGRIENGLISIEGLYFGNDYETFLKTITSQKIKPLTRLNPCPMFSAFLLAFS